MRTLALIAVLGLAACVATDPGLETEIDTVPDVTPIVEPAGAA